MMEAQDYGTKDKSPVPNSPAEVQTVEVTCPRSQLQTRNWLSLYAILVGYFYLVMVDCFPLRSKGRQPERPGLHVGREGTERVKVEGRSKRWISPPPWLVGCLGTCGGKR